MEPIRVQLRDAANWVSTLLDPMSPQSQGCRFITVRALPKMSFVGTYSSLNCEGRKYLLNYGPLLSLSSGVLLLAGGEKKYEICLEVGLLALASGRRHLLFAADLC